MKAQYKPSQDLVDSKIRRSPSKSIPYFPITQLKGHEGPINVVKFTTSQDRTIRLWNPLRCDPSYPTSLSSYLNSNSNTTSSIPPSAVPAALQIQQFSFTFNPTSVAIDNNATSVVTSLTDKSVQIVDIMTQQTKRRIYNAHTSRINAVQCVNSIDLILSGSYDNSVKIWDGRSTNNRDPVQILDQAKDSISCVQLLQTSSTTQILTASIDGYLRCYDVRKGLCQMWDCHDPITYFSLSHDRNCLLLHSLSSSNYPAAMYLLERTSGQVLNLFTADEFQNIKYALECQILAGDEIVVTGSENGNLVLFDLVSTKVVQVLKGHSRPTCTVACHSKNSMLLSGSYDGLSFVWIDPSQVRF